MSLKPQAIGPVPEETARIARAAYPKGTLYLQLRDALGTIYEDEQSADLFPQRGQPAEAPWRLALVCVLQFLEGLSDRQAADAVRGRLDWKYLLGLELSDSGFDHTVLVEFRQRLLSGKRDLLLFDLLLTRLREGGYLKVRGRQRSDSTHVLAKIRSLNRVEGVGETFRAALNSLAVAAPQWLKGQMQEDWVDRYEHRIEDYRLPTGKQASTRGLRRGDWQGWGKLALRSLWRRSSYVAARDSSGPDVATSVGAEFLLGARRTALARCLECARSRAMH